MNKLITWALWGVGVLAVLSFVACGEKEKQTTTAPVEAPTVVVSEASAQTIRDIAESVVQQRTSRRVQNHDREMAIWFGMLVTSNV